MSNNHFNQNINELIINIDFINDNLYLCERLNIWNFYLIGAQPNHIYNNLYYDYKNFKNNRVKALFLDNHKFNSLKFKFNFENGLFPISLKDLN